MDPDRSDDDGPAFDVECEALLPRELPFATAPTEISRPMAVGLALSGTTRGGHCKEGDSPTRDYPRTAPSADGAPSRSRIALPILQCDGTHHARASCESMPTRRLGATRHDLSAHRLIDASGRRRSPGSGTRRAAQMARWDCPRPDRTRASTRRSTPSCPSPGGGVVGVARSRFRRSARRRLECRTASHAAW